MSSPHFDINHLDDFTSPGCEHGGHGEGPNHDDGAAVALITLVCPACSDVTGPIFVCRNFGFGSYRIRCGRCQLIDHVDRFRKVLGQL